MWYTDKLSSLRTLLDVHDEFLLALLESTPLAIKFSLCFRQRALVLAQALGGGDGASKECFLNIK